MYLITWNGENRPEFSPSYIKMSDAQKEKSQIEIERLERAREVLPKIRRVLANVRLI
jgi:hypothetical protein